MRRKPNCCFRSANNGRQMIPAYMNVNVIMVLLDKPIVLTRVRL